MKFVNGVKTLKDSHTVGELFCHVAWLTSCASESHDSLASVMPKHRAPHVFRCSHQPAMAAKDKLKKNTFLCRTIAKVLDHSFPCLSHPFPTSFPPQPSTWAKPHHAVPIAKHEPFWWPGSCSQTGLPRQEWQNCPQLTGNSEVWPPWQAMKWYFSVRSLYTASLGLF